MGIHVVYNLIGCLRKYWKFLNAIRDIYIFKHYIIIYYILLKHLKHFKLFNRNITYLFHNFLLHIQLDKSMSKHLLRLCNYRHFYKGSENIHRYLRRSSKIVLPVFQMTWIFINGPLAMGGFLPPLVKNRKFRKKRLFGGPQFRRISQTTFLGHFGQKFFWSHDVILTYDVIFSQNWRNFDDFSIK